MAEPAILLIVLDAMYFSKYPNGNNEENHRLSHQEKWTSEHVRAAAWRWRPDKALQGAKPSAGLHTFPLPSSENCGICPWSGCQGLEAHLESIGNMPFPA
eukprot:1159097-Pelagomonas_calceolata.AAC.2